MQHHTSPKSKYPAKPRSSYQQIPTSPLSTPNRAPPKVNVEKQVDIIIIFKNEKLREFYGEQIQQKQFQADISYAFKEYFNEKIVNKKMIHKNKIIEELYYNMKTSNINIIHNNFIEFIFKNIENEYCGVSSLTNFNVNVSNEFKNNGSTFKKYEHSAFSLVFNLVNFIYYFKTRKLPSLICESNILKHSFKKSKWDDYFDTIIEKQEQVFEILKKSFSSPEKGFKNCNLLFSGPSGSGKTHVAMNVFNSIIGAQKSFASVAAGLLTGIVSESFNKLNEWREEAESTPYILRYIIIDEAHMCLEQSTNSHSNTSSGDREIKSFLLEALSDIEKKHPNLVFVLCTNYRDILQKEVIRSGRISHEIYFPYVTQSIVSKVLKSEFNINDPHFEKLFTCCTISDIIKICDICQNQTQIKSTLTSIHTENQNYAMANLCSGKSKECYSTPTNIITDFSNLDSSLASSVSGVLQKLDNAVLVKCYSQMNVPRDAEQRRLFFNSESFDIINMLSFGNVLIAFDLLSLEPYMMASNNTICSSSSLERKIPIVMSRPQTLSDYDKCQPEALEFINGQSLTSNTKRQAINITKQDNSVLETVRHIRDLAKQNNNSQKLFVYLYCNTYPTPSTELQQKIEYTYKYDFTDKEDPSITVFSPSNLVEKFIGTGKKYISCKFDKEALKLFDSDRFNNSTFIDCTFDCAKISLQDCSFENCTFVLDECILDHSRFKNGVLNSAKKCSFRNCEFTEIRLAAYKSKSLPCHPKEPMGKNEVKNWFDEEETIFSSIDLPACLNPVAEMDFNECDFRGSSLISCKLSNNDICSDMTYLFGKNNYYDIVDEPTIPTGDRSIDEIIRSFSVVGYHNWITWKSDFSNLWYTLKSVRVLLFFKTSTNDWIGINFLQPQIFRMRKEMIQRERYEFTKIQFKEAPLTAAYETSDGGQIIFDGIYNLTVRPSYVSFSQYFTEHNTQLRQRLFDSSNNLSCSVVEFHCLQR